MRYFVLIELLLIVEIFSKEEKNDVKENDLAHGFGDDIEWVKWSEAKEQAKALKKPIFLLIHKSWCGACQALKTIFRSSTERDEFVKLSKEFIMVNTEDDEEPKDERYSPDGEYIPRIFFLDVDGTPFENINNKASYPRNSHYFPQLPNLIKAMNKALKAFGSPTKGESDQTSDDDSTEQQKMKADEKADEHSGCPHAAKVSAMKKEEEAKEKAKKKEKNEATNESDKVTTDKEETHTKSDSREKKEDEKERRKEDEIEKDEDTRDKKVGDKEKSGEKQKTEL